MDGRRWGWYPYTLLFWFEPKDTTCTVNVRMCIVAVNDGLSGLQAPTMDSLTEETAK